MRFALETKGFRFLHILAPCPTGWKSEPAEGIELVLERMPEPSAKGEPVLAWRRRVTGETGSGNCSAMRFASSNSALVIVSKSACCSRSRSE